MLHCILLSVIGGMLLPAGAGAAGDAGISADALPAQCVDMLENHRIWHDSFELAQREVGLHQGGNDKYNMQKRQIFFAPNFGSEIFLLHNKSVSYDVIFKGGSEMIAITMARNDECREEDYHGVYSSRRTTSLSARTAMSLSIFKKSVTRSFTFIRDPLSHFVSGVVEAHMRKVASAHPKHTPELEALYQKHRVDVNMARTVLNCIIAENESASEYLVGEQHFSIQSQSMHYWKPGFIGQLENLNTGDWSKLNQYLGTNISFVSRPHHDHESSRDPMNMKGALLELLEADPRYMRAVCHLLMVDYVCMRDLYTLPPQCRNMKI
jgi:hypothetical protein